MPFDPQASFGKSLFFGEVLEDQLYPFPELSKETTETVRALLDPIRKSLSKLDRRKMDREAEQSPELLQELRELGLFGLIIPEEFGGLGLGSAAYARVFQEIASYDASVSLTIGAHTSIGMKGLLLFGTREQQQRYLPRLATGELIAAFALTEPGSGSDAFSIKTSAEKTLDGKHFILNGQKLWISNGGFADFFTVFAKTQPDTSVGKGKVTAFLVERSFGGLSHGPHEDKMGMRASSTTSIYFDNCKVPVENVLGEEGKGFKVAVSILNHGRTGLGAGTTGGQRKILSLAAQRATERKQFGRPIGSFGLVKEKLGRMATYAYVSESMTYWVAHTIDRGSQDYSVEGAAVKVFCSEAMWNAADEALQIAGGMGYMKDEPWEQAVRDSRINRIYEGTNEINRLYVGLNGVQKPGEYLKGLGQELSNALRDPIKSLGFLREFAERKVRQTVPYDRAQITKAHPIFRRQVGQIEDMVQTFAGLCESELRKYGKGIVDEQFAVRRLADIAIDLIAVNVVIARTTGLLERRGIEKSKQEIEMTKLFAHEARHRIIGCFRKASRNRDAEIKSIADAVLERGGAGHDVLDG
jgi:acyl-CoA dehydrogenase family protein 9